MQEILTSANMAFSMCPLLNQGAIDMLLHHASEEHKETYLPKMLTLVWTGTTNLPEPQTGFAAGAITLKAVLQGVDTSRITGKSVFLYLGSHNFSMNHLTLAPHPQPSGPTGPKRIHLS